MSIRRRCDSRARDTDANPQQLERRGQVELHHPAFIRPGEWTGDIELADTEADQVRPKGDAGAPCWRTRTAAQARRAAPCHAAVDECGDLRWNRAVHRTLQSERAKERQPELEVANGEAAAKEIVQLGTSRRQHRNAVVHVPSDIESAYEPRISQVQRRQPGIFRTTAITADVKCTRGNGDKRHRHDVPAVVSGDVEVLETAEYRRDLQPIPFAADHARRAGITGVA